VDRYRSFFNDDSADRDSLYRFEFPGIAITPSPQNKKIDFLRHMIRRLALDNAEARRARAEDYAPAAPFATVVARAVTSTAGLLGLGARLVREDGVLLAMKGRHPADELEALPDDWTFTVTELDVPGLEGHARHLVRLTRRSTG